MEKQPKGIGSAWGNRFLPCLTFFILLCFWQTPARSAPFQFPQPGYVHRIWQSEEGIPNPVVRSLLQARDGYIWFATEEGLVRFDGVDFREIETKATQEKTLRWFTGLLEARDGSIWASSVNGGVLRVKNGESIRYTANEGLLTNYVLTIAEDSRGSIWIGTASGLCEFTGGKFISHTNEPGLLTEAVRAIHEDRNGNLWVGTAIGLSCRTDGKWKSYTTNDLLVNNAVLCFCEDKKGGLWIGTSGGITYLRDKKSTHFTVQNGLAHNLTRAILEDSQGNVWFGTQSALQQFKDGKIRNIQVRNPADPDFEGISFIYSLIEDSEQNIWVGTNLGLNRLRRQDFVTISRDEGLSHNLATCVFQDRAGDIWIGTYGGGLCRIHGHEIQTFTMEDGLASNHILSVAEDADGTIWIGTDGAGLNRLRDGVITHFSDEKSSSANVIRAIYRDSKTNLWIASNAGANRFENGAFIPEPNLPRSTVKAVAQDSGGRMWFAGQSGLVQMADTWMLSYKRADGFTPESANAIYPDKEKTYWIGTETGLFCFREGKFFNFKHVPELAQQRVFHIIEDNSGNLWLSTRNGIFSVNKQQLLDSLHTGKSVNPLVFGKSNAMRRAQCNGVGQPAGLRSRDGRIWFPTMHGVVVFDPAHISGNEAAPRVMIESLTVNGQTLPTSQKLELKPRNGTLEFTFTALSFQAPEKVRFRYKLDGVDDDWVDAGTDRKATYGNLRPGDYTFHVRACNNDGIWNETGASIGFTVVPRFYQTYIFYALCAFGFAGLVLTFMEIKERRSRRREKRLMNLVEVHTEKLKKSLKTMESFNYSIAHDLRAPLRAIRGLTEALLQDYGESFDETARDYSRRIELSVDRMDALITDLLAFGRITHKEVTFSEVDLELLVAKVIHERELEIASSHAKIEVEKPLPKIWASEVLMQQILSNLLSNALKFVPKDTAPEILIWAEEAGGSRVRLYIRDNGIGIDAEHQQRIFGVFERLHGNDEYPGTGIGLAIVQKAVEQMEGSVGLKSRKGRGSCFWIELPGKK